MKKGFTLAEILGIIVIIGLLLILIVPPIINRISGSGDEAKDAENEFIYNATDVYINEHHEKYPPGKSGKYCILIQDLIDDGLLVEPVNDVVTGEDLSDKSVLVTIYSTGTKEYEIKEGAECKDISALPMIDFIIEPTGSSWVKQRKVTIIYPTMEGEYQARYRREDENSNNWINDNAYNNGGRHTNIIFNKSSKLTTIEAQLKGNQIISGRVNVVNVDSDIPRVKSITYSKVSGNQITFRVVGYDKTSGVNGIYVSTSRSTPNENASGWDYSMTSEGGVDTAPMNITKGIGTYYIYVKDKAGNISNINDGGTVVISNATYHPERWYCPSGYTSSGSGSSMRCSKTTYTNAQYHSGYYYCPKKSVSQVRTICLMNDIHWPNEPDTSWTCGSVPSSYPNMSGNYCYTNWFNIRGKVECDLGTVKCGTQCNRDDNYYECDDSTYNENGPSGCAGTSGFSIHYPTVKCRDRIRRSYQSSYYSCPSGYIQSGTGSSTRCYKTTTTSPRHQSAYYSCSSGTLVGSMCFGNS